MSERDSPVLPVPSLEERLSNVERRLDAFGDLKSSCDDLKVLMLNLVARLPPSIINAPLSVPANLRHDPSPVRAVSAVTEVEVGHGPKQKSSIGDLILYVLTRLPPSNSAPALSPSVIPEVTVTHRGHPSSVSSVSEAAVGQVENEISDLDDVDDAGDDEVILYSRVPIIPTIYPVIFSPTSGLSAFEVVKGFSVIYYTEEYNFQYSSSIRLGQLLAQSLLCLFFAKFSTDLDSLSQCVNFLDCGRHGWSPPEIDSYASCLYG
jgi:hypothetical protein